MSVCLTSRPAEMYFFALSTCLSADFWALPGSPQPSMSGGTRQHHGMGSVSCFYSRRRQQRIYISSSTLVPTAICPLWAKIFLIFSQPFLYLLCEFYMNWKEVEVNAFCLLQQLCVTPLLLGCTFFYDHDTKTGDRHFFSARLSV